jgi:hypothetical protein
MALLNYNIYLFEWNKYNGPLVVIRMKKQPQTTITGELGLFVNL